MVAKRKGSEDVLVLFFMVWICIGTFVVVRGCDRVKALNTDELPEIGQYVRTEHVEGVCTGYSFDLQKFDVRLENGTITTVSREEYKHQE